MKNASKLTWIGVALLLAGPLILVAWRHWDNTRTLVASSTPLPPAVKSLRTPEFEVNMDHIYEISVQMHRPFPNALQNCVTGARDELYNCNKNPVLKARWRVWSDGRVVAQGLSDSNDSVPEHWVEYGTATSDPLLQRSIGQFASESGRRYLLDVSFAGDLDSLAGAQPYLVVDVPVTYGEEEDDKEFALFCLTVLMGIAGVITLAIGARGRLRGKNV